jgi:oligopeptide/dipeptide ABC transporter ATP-binding protein
MGVVAEIADRVVVMYQGRKVEEGPVAQVFSDPQHPYTKALLSAVPVADPKIGRSRERIILQGDLPSPVNPPSGCVFNTRCWKAQDICRTAVPETIQETPLQTVACHFPEA